MRLTSWHLSPTTFAILLGALLRESPIQNPTMIRDSTRSGRGYQLQMLRRATKTEDAFLLRYHVMLQHKIGNGDGNIGILSLL